MVIHFGGATYNIEIISVKDGVMQDYAKANLDIGGNDLNKRLIEEMVRIFKNKH